MTSQFSKETWYLKIRSQLDNASTENPVFNKTVKDYENLANSFLELKNLNIQCLFEIDKLKNKEKLLELSDSELNFKFCKQIELETELEQNKVELSKNARENQKLVKNIQNLNKSIQKYERDILNLQLQLKNIKDELLKTNNKFSGLVDLSKEKDKAIVILQDELSTCHLELIKLDEKVKKFQQDKKNEEKSQTKSKLSEPKNKDNESKPSKQYWMIKPKSKSSYSCLCSSNDNTVFAAAGNCVNIYSSKEGELMQTINLKSKATDLKFNNTDEFLAIALSDNTIGFYSIKVAAALKNFKGHIGNIYSIDFKGQTELVSCSHDRTIKIWDIEYGSCTDTIFGVSCCNSISISSERGLMVSAHSDSTIRIWDNRTPQKMMSEYKYEKDRITSAYMTKEKSHILFSSRDHSINTIDANNGTIINEYSNDNLEITVDWYKIALDESTKQLALIYKNKICLLNTQTMALLREDSLPGTNLNALCWINQQSIAVTNENSDILVYNLKENQNALH